MTFSAKSIANYFLDLAARTGESIDPLKLQKLVFYAHGWYAGYTGEPLLQEPIEAWDYGPVVPSLYREFRRFGSSEIEGRATEQSGFLRYEIVPAPDDPDVRALLEDVWQKYGQFDGWRLSEMTHAPDGPWAHARRVHPGGRGAMITLPLIREYFQRAIERMNEAAPTGEHAERSA